MAVLEMATQTGQAGLNHAQVCQSAIPKPIPTINDGTP